MVCHFHEKVQTPERVKMDLDLVGKTLVGLYPVRKHVVCCRLKYHSYGGDLKGGYISIAFVFSIETNWETWQCIPPPLAL